MKKKLIAIYFVLTALITLAGCGGAAKYPNYYTLYVPPPPDPPVQKGCPRILGRTRIPIAHLPASRRHRLQNISRTNRFL
jgi:hypothetical protein